MAKSALYGFLLCLFYLPHFSASLQVTPNSPCASVCQDSADLDASDPGSSTTRNSDIACEDADYSSAAGTKFKKCMTCLQTSTFSQGSESDTMWFLYNLRYAAAYCVFGYPDATNFSPTPCTTRTACGDLEDNIRHGIPDPKGTTAYSYCSAGDGNAMDFSRFESCISCTSALGTTDYLANYFAVLGVACQQQPAPGTPLNLNDTIFSHAPIGPGSDDDNDEDGGQRLGTTAVVGIVAGALAVLLLGVGITLVCLRKRRKQYIREGRRAGYDFFHRRRRRSSISFQCQTHMISPRFWPGVTEEGVQPPMAENSDAVLAMRAPEDQQQQQQQHHDDTLATVGNDDTTGKANSGRKGISLQITTTSLPAPPPHAYASSAASSIEKTHHSPSDFRYPPSAETATSTTALLPPYPLPSPPYFAPPPAQAEHHSKSNSKSNSGSSSSSSSSGGGGSSGGNRSSESGSSRFSVLLGKKSPRLGNGVWRSNSGSNKAARPNRTSGSPVESRTIQTTFPPPPRR
ncbi:hypothetical protein VTH82DRAFT_1963 [Thermothelomyces myriococcoides]